MSSKELEIHVSSHLAVQKFYSGKLFMHTKLTHACTLRDAFTYTHKHVHAHMQLLKEETFCEWPLYEPAHWKGDDSFF